jgi:hypothetical protein
MQTFLHHFFYNCEVLLVLLSVSSHFLVIEVGNVWGETVLLRVRLKIGGSWEMYISRVTELCDTIKYNNYMWDLMIAFITFL